MLVGKNASGMYVIDEDYKIISYNLAAREIYPQLKRGEKCYHCLRNRETPWDQRSEELSGTGTEYPAFG